MYCSQCGTKAQGNFCSQCGARLNAIPMATLVDDQGDGPSEVITLNVAQVAETGKSKSKTDPLEQVVVLRQADLLDLPGDWEQEADYQRLVKIPAIRTTITRFAVNAKKEISGEAFLAIYDKVVASPVPLEKLAGIVQPLYAAWGMRTGKQRTELLRLPVGRVIVAALCSLARHGQTLRTVEQHPTGCVLTADLPSSFWALKGDLLISIVSQGTDTQVDASTNIPGQVTDWGKSQRCLDQLFAELQADLGLVGRNAG